ncbi:hypothetical protein EDB80DRAFT_106344 [Ilyonectria destructans]|nr:hypothetical protein EDB80DRAFT_106344 [Ilyonectria destructans]
MKSRFEGRGLLVPLVLRISPADPDCGHDKLPAYPAARLLGETSWRQSRAIQSKAMSVSLLWKRSSLPGSFQNLISLPSREHHCRRDGHANHRAEPPCCSTLLPRRLAVLKVFSALSIPSPPYHVSPCAQRTGLGGSGGGVRSMLEESKERPVCSF